MRTQESNVARRTLDKKHTPHVHILAFVFVANTHMHGDLSDDVYASCNRRLPSVHTRERPGRCNGQSIDICYTLVVGK
jgi:hypothetical protein